MTDNETIRDDLFNIGAQVRVRREDAGLSRTELARRAGTTSRTVAHLETGNSISLTILLKILSTLKNQLTLTDPDPHE